MLLLKEGTLLFVLMDTFMIMTLDLMFLRLDFKISVIKKLEFIPVEPTH